MANLFTGKIIATDYADLFEQANISPVEETAYQLQIRNGIAFLREGTVGTGFILNDGETLTYTDKGSTLYIKTNPDGVVVNIAE